jgi:cupin fold WbuC family metalloprotein
MSCALVKRADALSLWPERCNSTFMRAKQQNNEVLYSDEPIVKVRRSDIEFLKQKSSSNERQRIRLCAHKDVDDKLHEMFIVHGKDAYVRPHKHLHKSESFHVIEGEVDVVLFDDSGCITEVIKMGAYSTGRNFYFRIAEPYYHTLLIRSQNLVFHETTNGPFGYSDTVFADWSPEQSDITGQREFIARVNKDVEELAH